MKLPKSLLTTLYILGSLCSILLVAVLVILIMGAQLPYTHTTTVTGTVEASPDRVFAVIADVANGPKWRKQLAGVQVLPPEEGSNGPEDRWIEDLGHNQTMSFLAIKSIPPDATGHALRVVRLNDPDATYGGTWTYRIVPGPNPNQTVLQITEDGFIKPWIYRFAMVHIFGMKSNLESYMHSIQGVFAPRKS
jgi:hypothetical protein